MRVYILVGAGAGNPCCKVMAKAMAMAMATNDPPHLP